MISPLQSLTALEPTLPNSPFSRRFIRSCAHALKRSTLKIRPTPSPVVDSIDVFTALLIPEVFPNLSSSTRPTISPNAISIPISSLLNPVNEAIEVDSSTDDGADIMRSTSYESSKSSDSESDATFASAWAPENSSDEDQWVSAYDEEEEELNESDLDDDENCRDKYSTYAGSEWEGGSPRPYDGQSLYSVVMEMEEERYNENFVDFRTVRKPLPERLFWQGFIPVDKSGLMRRWVVQKRAFEAAHANGW